MRKVKYFLLITWKTWEKRVLCFLLNNVENLRKTVGYSLLLMKKMWGYFQSDNTKKLRENVGFFFVDNSENLREKSGICWAQSGLAYLSFAWKSWDKSWENEWNRLV